MAKFPVLPIWTDALLGDTTHMNATEFGAYMLMLIVAWRDPSCSLPLDDRYLRAITRLGPHFNKFKGLLLEMWSINENGRLIQSRLMKERDFQIKKKTSGRLGGKAKSLKNKKSSSGEILANGLANGKQTPSLPLPSTLIGDKETSSLSLAPKTARNGHVNEIIKEFPLWYILMPRKEAPGDAEKAFLAAMKSVDLQTLMEGAKRYAAAMEGKERQFIKSPARWLRAKCWLDDAASGGPVSKPQAPRGPAPTLDRDWIERIERGE